jgi:MFS family permease
MKDKENKIFFRGWLMVAACMFGVSAGPAAFILGSIGLFLNGFQQEFGWTRTEMGSAVSGLMIATALCLPLAGRLIDRFGVQRVLAPSVLLFALLLLSVPLVNHLWQFILIYILIGIFAVGTNSTGYMRLLASWFDRRRGLAICIAGSGTGLGFAYVPVITHYAVTAYGWRGGYVVLGLILLCINLPIVLFILKNTPADVNLQVDGRTDTSDAVAERQEAGDTLREAMTGRDFWYLALTFVSVAFVLYGIIPHLVPLLEDRGFETETAAWIASLFGIATFGGRILIGWLIDHFEARFVALVFFWLSAIGMGLLAIDLPFWAVLLSAVLLGGSLGAEVDMLAYLVSRYFGLRSFSQIFSVLFSMVMFSMSLGPVIFGAVYDATQSYTIVVAAGVPACIFAIFMLSLLGKRPVEHLSELRAKTTPTMDPETQKVKS